MIKIFAYELRRLMLNKFYLILCIAISIYSYSVLRGSVILGISGTAPFSPWSFGWYVSQIAPLVSIGLLLPISALFSKKEKSVQLLTLPSCISIRGYFLARLCAIILATSFFCALTFGIAMVFYAQVFAHNSVAEFLLPALVVFLPMLLFSAGIGLFAGKIYPAAVYVLMLLMLMIGFVPVPEFFDLTASRYFVEAPQLLASSLAGEVPFRISAGFAVSRTLFTAIGLLIGVTQTYNHYVKQR